MNCDIQVQLVDGLRHIVDVVRFVEVTQYDVFVLFLFRCERVMFRIRVCLYAGADGLECIHGLRDDVRGVAINAAEGKHVATNFFE